MDPNNSAPPAGSPAASPAGGGATPPAGGDASPPAATRPDWLPEAHWDPQAGIKPEFGQVFNELSTFHKTETERQAALKARKPDDIKFEIKLPETVKVPEGMKVEIDPKDPRIPMIRQLALDHGLDQGVIDKLIALDAQMKIEGHTAETQRIAAEDLKLGANVKERKDAVSNWAKGLRDRNELSADEYEEIRLTATTAAGVTALEKLIAKSSGAVPGQGGHQPAPQTPPATVEQRWYGQKG